MTSAQYEETPETDPEQAAPINATSDIARQFVIELLGDLSTAAVGMGRREAVFLVSNYYRFQDQRIRIEGQKRSLKVKPSEAFQAQLKMFSTAEHVLKSNLLRFAKQWKVGNWLMAQKGIGPCIAAGLLAHLDLRGSQNTPGHCQTAGHFFSFAGLQNNIKWEKGKRRPYSADLKKLCYKLGESFIKVQNRDGAIYGQYYRQRRDYEDKRNFAGELADQAAEKLERFDIGKSTDAHKWYSGRYTPGQWIEYRRKVAEAIAAHIDEITAAETAADRNKIKSKAEASVPKPKPLAVGEGLAMLPPDHLKSRARRHTVKLLLSHLHHVMYLDYFGKEPEAPYAFTDNCPGDHRHFIEPPGLNETYPGRPLEDLYAD